VQTPVASEHSGLLPSDDRNLQSTQTLLPRMLHRTHKPGILLTATSLLLSTSVRLSVCLCICLLLFICLSPSLYRLGRHLRLRVSVSVCLYFSRFTALFSCISCCIYACVCFVVNNSSATEHEYQLTKCHRPRPSLFVFDVISM